MPKYKAVKSTIILLLVSLLTYSPSFSQERKITVRILDSLSQKPVKDANVIILGTTLGTFTNFLGYFELTIDPAKHKILVVSCIGYRNSEIVIPDTDRFKVLLTKERTMLKSLNLNYYPKSAEKKTQTRKRPEKEGFIVLESEAYFPDGMDQFYDYMGNHLKKSGVQLPPGGINVHFTINDEGKAKDILVSDSTSDVKKYVINALNEVTPWVPANQRQKNVDQFFLLPIVDLLPPNLNDFYKYVGGVIRYPAQARRMGAEGTVFVEFQIDPSGNLISTKILRNVEGSCGEEVKLAISKVPADILKSLIQKTNSTIFVLPVSFGLERPFKNSRSVQTNQAFLLSEIVVTAIGR